MPEHPSATTAVEFLINVDDDAKKICEGRKFGEKTNGGSKIFGLKRVGYHIADKNNSGFYVFCGWFCPEFDVVLVDFVGPSKMEIYKNKLTTIKPERLIQIEKAWKFYKTKKTKELEKENEQNSWRLVEEEDRRTKIQSIMGLTTITIETEAKSLLEKSNWNLETALQQYTMYVNGYTAPPVVGVAKSNIDAGEFGGTAVVEDENFGDDEFI